jgi:hypothetical protein
MPITGSTAEDNSTGLRLSCFPPERQKNLEPPCMRVPTTLPDQECPAFRRYWVHGAEEAMKIYPTAAQMPADVCDSSPRRGLLLTALARKVDPPFSYT